MRERLIDAVADRLGLDRVTARRHNLITATEMPFGHLDGQRRLGHVGRRQRVAEPQSKEFWPAASQERLRRNIAGEK